jgi:hypothetical protein
LGISKLVAGSGEIAIDNKTVSWDNNSTNSKTVFLKSYFRPVISEIQKQLTYILNTSIQINAYDFLGSEITTFDAPVEIKINFSDMDLQGIARDTLKIYFWNSDIKLWEALPTVLDLVANTATALTSHLSNFAVLGEKSDSAPPTTQLIVSGTKEGNWYTSYPTVTLTAMDAENSPTTSFYTLDGESEWEEYTSPVLVNQDGMINLQYRSTDDVGNLEETQSYVLQVNSKGITTKTVRIRDTSFNITE